MPRSKTTTSLYYVGLTAAVCAGVAPAFGAKLRSPATEMSVEDAGAGADEIADGVASLGLATPPPPAPPVEEHAPRPTLETLPGEVLRMMAEATTRGPDMSRRPVFRLTLDASGVKRVPAQNEVVVELSKGEVPRPNLKKLRDTLDGSDGIEFKTRHELSSAPGGRRIEGFGTVSGGGKVPPPSGQN